MCSTTTVYGCFYFSENPKCKMIASKNYLFQQQKNEIEPFTAAISDWGICVA